MILVDACVWIEYLQAARTSAVKLLEHLEKKLGFELMFQMEAIARRKMIVIVPNGPTKQEAYDGNQLQLHRSSWTHDDFDNLGFRVKGINGLRHLRGDRGVTRFHPHLLWEIVTDLTQPFVEKSLHYASHLYASKAI